MERRIGVVYPAHDLLDVSEYVDPLIAKSLHDPFLGRPRVDPAGFADKVRVEAEKQAFADLVRAMQNNLAEFPENVAQLAAIDRATENTIFFSAGGMM